MTREEKENLPKFDTPPVAEVAIGVQFDALRGYTSAHAGWYWKSRLDAQWTGVRQVDRLEDQFERFDDRRWATSGIRIKRATEPGRTQIIRDDDERLIQLQNTRFIYNWRRSEGGSYPSYEKLCPEFDREFDRFRAFVAEAELGPLIMNQWEVTYVNHVLKDSWWESPADWQRILPGFYVPAQSLEGLDPEGLSAEWHLDILQNQGRLHVSVEYGRIGSPSGPEALVLTLTARGPIEKDQELLPKLHLGHKYIVSCFAEITSPEAHTRWNRRASR